MFSSRRRAGLVQTGILVVLSSCAVAAAESPTGAEDKPLTISDSAVRGAARFHVEPEYPATARQFHLSGEVLAEVTVGVDGKVENVAVTKGNPLLSAAVVAALKKWIFNPFSVDGHPTRVKSTMTFAFRL